MERQAAQIDGAIAHRAAGRCAKAESAQTSRIRSEMLDRATWSRTRLAGAHDRTDERVRIGTNRRPIIAASLDRTIRSCADDTARKLHSAEVVVGAHLRKIEFVAIEHRGITASGGDECAVNRQSHIGPSRSAQRELSAEPAPLLRSIYPAGDMLIARGLKGDRMSEATGEEHGNPIRLTECALDRIKAPLIVPHSDVRL